MRLLFILCPRLLSGIWTVVRVSWQDSLVGKGAWHEPRLMTWAWLLEPIWQKEWKLTPLSGPLTSALALMCKQTEKWVMTYFLYWSSQCHNGISEGILQNPAMRSAFSYLFPYSLHSFKSINVITGESYRMVKQTRTGFMLVNKVKCNWSFIQLYLTQYKVIFMDYHPFIP